jgi:hypothetical protein
MQTRRRQVLQHAVAVIVAARWWILASLPVLWLVTGVLCRFSPIWLWAVTTVMSSVPFLVVLYLLITQERHRRALSRRLHRLERTIKQREAEAVRALKHRQSKQHNGRGTL